MRSSADIEPVMTRVATLPLVACAALLLLAATVQAAPSPRTTYTAALSRATAARAALDAETDATRAAALRSARGAVNAFEDVVRRFPTSGYCDDALWSAAQLAADAWRRFDEDRDRATAGRLLEFLRREYPRSRFVRRIPEALARLQPARAARRSTPRPSARPESPARDRARQPPPARPVPVTAAPAVVAATPPLGTPPRTAVVTATSAAAPVSALPRALATPAAPFVPLSPDTEVPDDYVASGAGTPPPTRAMAAAPAFATLRRIRRDVLATGVRLTLELDAEVPYRDTQTATPPRVSIDLRHTRPDNPLPGTPILAATSVVRQLHVVRANGDTSRVLVDTLPGARYSLFMLYNPFRIVVDVEPAATGAPAPMFAERTSPSALPRPAAATATPAPLSVRSPMTEPVLAPGAPASPDLRSQRDSDIRSGNASALPIGDTDAPAAAAAKPTSPSSNIRGGFSLSRQLGLSVSRIVIDPGHGGHDPGAQVKGLNEADLVLDVALKLQQLLQKEPGVEVVMTRRTDVFIPLEERTAIANRAGADLFLSIHANASRNPAARGIETYFLNFAPNPEAEAIAARENASSGRAMHHLPDLVRSIALNNKIDESRDFAALVQQALVGKVKGAKSLGVKQAPFVVLIGATMPSILAEISFITNREDFQQLKPGAARQKIAEALFAGVMRYHRALKTATTVASQ